MRGLESTPFKTGMVSKSLESVLVWFSEAEVKLLTILINVCCTMCTRGDVLGLDIMSWRYWRMLVLLRAHLPQKEFRAIVPAMPRLLFLFPCPKLCIDRAWSHEQPKN